MQHPSIDVVITNVEIKQFESGNQYKITGDTNRGQMKFKFYQTKADGTEGSAYQQWRSMGLKIGSTVNVAYSEEQKEYQGKPYTDRRVIWFRETNTPASALSSNSGANGGQLEAPTATSNPNFTVQNKERNWDREAYEKTCSIWVAAELDKQQYDVIKQHIEEGVYFYLFQAIRQSGYEHFEAKSESVAGKPVTSSAKEAFDRGMAKAQKDPQQMIDEIIAEEREDIDVESIPF
ncbi:MAG: hypothetical protein M3362_00370 [Acidobacteriota bacterium]|nr:hypothetical protein [Acidobacteriota bacterium]